ncbi:MAG: DUF370 domain-containing protein [Oscillospiraceae bacterium]|nr:DUF370 domain-containing protein [Oscillospiraceae bacterium]
MYIYLGSDQVVRDSEVIGIFDIESSVQADTREYLAAAGRRKTAVYVSYEMPKSFITSIEDGREKVYITNVSRGTIVKRSRDTDRKWSVK